MRHTLLFVSSVALAAVLNTAYAENTPKPNQASEATTESTEVSPAETTPADAAKEAAEAGEATEATTEGSETAETAESAEASEEAPADGATETTADNADAPAEDAEAPKDGEADDANAEDKSAEASPDATVPPTEGAAVYIIYPSDGSEVTSPVKVVFGLDGMGIAPAGVDVEKTGHHHLIVDGGDELPAAGEVMGDNVLHFGGGQTETDLELEPGEHTLQLILGDKEHKPFDPTLVSEKVTITVK